MKLNKEEFEHTKSLMTNGSVVQNKDWVENQPSLQDRNRFIDDLT